MVLTGEAGTGKTLLCRSLLDRLGADAPAILLTNSHFPDRAGLFQAILYDLSLRYEGLGEQELRLALTDQLLQSLAAGRPTVLVLDEAQHLTIDLLEELRLLGNLEASGSKALQVILAGQPTLLKTLDHREVASFRQRLAVRVHLEPLGVQEAADYLLHHLRIAGGRPERLLGDDAAELLARQTGGVPRLLNQAAQQALTLALEAGAASVDVEAAMDALALLGLDNAEAETATAERPTGIGEGIPPVIQSPAAVQPIRTKETASIVAADDSACRLFLSPPEAG
jgi:type II secretory pathway predicted ATPase ExeA